MARNYFGLGARGDLVGQIQRALAAAGHSPKEINEVYGEDTLDAVVAYQGEKKLSITGVVDEPTWNALLHCPVPAVSDRSLALTASFDGHGYCLARGNHNGEWLTWGIVGFSLRAGHVQSLLRRIHATHPDLIGQAFGRNSAILMEVMGLPAPQQKAWATSLTIRGGELADPWRTGFATLGSFPEVRQEQRRLALENYYKPALDCARGLGVSTELGLALLFDIYVAGGLSAAAMEQVREDVAASRDATDANIREIIADAAAEDAIPKNRDDVRARALAIARGSGEFRGHTYELANWGLADLAASVV